MNSHDAGHDQEQNVDHGKQRQRPCPEGQVCREKALDGRPGGCRVVAVSSRISSRRWKFSASVLKAAHRSSENRCRTSSMTPSSSLVATTRLVRRSRTCGGRGVPVRLLPRGQQRGIDPCRIRVPESTPTQSHSGTDPRRGRVCRLCGIRRSSRSQARPDQPGSATSRDATGPAHRHRAGGRTEKQSSPSATAIAPTFERRLDCLTHRDVLRFSTQPQPGVTKQAHPAAVFGPLRWHPRVLHRAEDPLGMRHRDRHVAVLGTDRRDARGEPFGLKG